MLAPPIPPLNESQGCNREQCDRRTGSSQSSPSSSREAKGREIGVWVAHSTVLSLLYLWTHLLKPHIRKKSSENLDYSCRSSVSFLHFSLEIQFELAIVLFPGILWEVCMEGSLHYSLCLRLMGNLLLKRESLFWGEP